ncbi:MAG TPA: DNA-3-methyladenine glycosylase [Tissierellaceae bacterium]|nr:DNA-3-methyladenine glycosylase [Tissierellaceae bacterium]
MNYFKYGEDALKHLKERDEKLGKEIDKIGMIEREINSDLFSGLISSVISQQISTKAAITVTNRLMELVGELTPENLEIIEVEEIQKCGMSLRKAGYIKGIAEAAITKEIDFENLHKLSDEQVTKELTKLKGIGEWTAEMVLIHSLHRPDILSYKDLGIRRGIMRLHELDELSEKEFEIYKDLYSPYGTVASLYLWEISSR